jgi:hypothetical protein
MERKIVNHKWKCERGHWVGEDYKYCSLCASQEYNADRINLIDMLRDKEFKNKYYPHNLYIQKHGYPIPQQSKEEGSPEPPPQGVPDEAASGGSQAPPDEKGKAAGVAGEEDYGGAGGPGSRIILRPHLPEN